MTEKIFLSVACMLCLVPFGTALYAIVPSGPSKSGTEDMVRSLFPLEDSDWKSLELIVDVEDLPREPLVMILYRLQQRHIVDLLRERIVSSAALDGLVQGSVAERTGDVYVRKIVACETGPLKDGSESMRFYICDLTVDGRRNATCVTSRIPQAWLGPVSQDGHAPIRFDPQKKTGFLGILVVSGAEPVFVASRLRDGSDSLLGRYGMDMSLLDEVRPISVRDLMANNVTPEKLRVLKFTASDFEPFYRMLVTASTIPPAEVDAEISAIKQRETASNKFTVRDFFNHPESQQGRLVRLSGHARRIERIAVTDPEVVKRFGIDHYYQIALFTEESQDNPIMVCVAGAPKGLPTGEGKTFNVPMSVNAFFYKIWAYEKWGDSRSFAVRGADSEKGKSVQNNLQFAPLLIAAKVDWHQMSSENRMDDGAEKFFFSSIGVFGFFVMTWIVFRFIRPRSSRVRFQLVPTKNDSFVYEEEQETPESPR